MSCTCANHLYIPILPVLLPPAIWNQANNTSYGPTPAYRIPPCRLRPPKRNCAKSFKVPEMLNGGELISYILLGLSSRRDPCRYEMRRECQEILPGLLLGPFQASKSLEILQGLRITHMWASASSAHLTRAHSILSHGNLSVCIRDAKEAFSVKPRFPEYFQYLVLDVEDNEEQNLIRLFPGWVFRAYLC